MITDDLKRMTEELGADMLWRRVVLRRALRGSRQAILEISETYRLWH